MGNLFTFFMHRNKNIFLFIIILFLLPFLLLFLLKLGNFIHKETGFFINTVDIGNKEVYAFLGSYLGGIATLAAVFLTMKHNKETLQYQNSITYFDKEKENIANALSKINTLTVNSAWNQYNIAIHQEKSAEKISNILKSISLEREQIVLARIELLLKTDILDKTMRCEKCNKKEMCDMYKHKEEFSKLYYDTEDILYKSLHDIDEYIKVSSANYDKHVNIIKAQELFEKSESKEEKVQLSEIIKNFKEMLLPDDEATVKLNESVSKISRIHLDDKTRLIYLAKCYYFARCDLAYKNCITMK